MVVGSSSLVAAKKDGSPTGGVLREKAEAAPFMLFLLRVLLGQVSIYQEERLRHSTLRTSSCPALLASPNKKRSNIMRAQEPGPLPPILHCTRNTYLLYHSTAVWCSSVAISLVRHHSACCCRQCSSGTGIPALAMPRLTSCVIASYCFLLTRKQGESFSVL